MIVWSHHCLPITRPLHHLMIVWSHHCLPITRPLHYLMILWSHHCLPITRLFYHLMFVWSHHCLPITRLFYHLVIVWSHHCLPITRPFYHLMIVWSHHCLDVLMCCFIFSPFRFHARQNSCHLSSSLHTQVLPLFVILKWLNGLSRWPLNDLLLPFCHCDFTQQVPCESIDYLKEAQEHRGKLEPLFLIYRVRVLLATIIARVGQNHIYIRCIHGIFGREITEFTVIYGVYIRFWPTLIIAQGPVTVFSTGPCAIIRVGT